MLFAAFTSAMVVRRGLSDDWVSMPKPPILLVNTAILLASSLALELARRARQVQRLVDRRHRSRRALSRRAGPRLESVERRQRLHFHQSEQFLFLRAECGSRGPSAGRSQRAVLCRCTGLAAQSRTRQAHRHRYQRDLLAFSGWALVVFDLSLIHISEPTRLGMISYAVFCLKKKKQK